MPSRSNLLLVFPDLAHHNLATLLRHGLRVTVNSDDLAYFGGYIADNMVASADALNLSQDELVQLARNSFLASFLDEEDTRHRLSEIDRFVGAGG